MPGKAQLPQAAQRLRDKITNETAKRLDALFTPEDRRWFKTSPAPDAARGCIRTGAGPAGCPMTQWALNALQELTMPGYFCLSHEAPHGDVDLGAELNRAAGVLYDVLFGHFIIEMDEAEAREDALHTALGLIQQLPEFRERAAWNILASLKDPAVWDRFVLRNETRLEELGRLDLLAQIDQAIEARDRSLYLAFLREHKLDYAYDYQVRLVKRCYPGWRMLLLHDIAHQLAVGAKTEGAELAPRPTPLLPRAISEYAASLYQGDLHPECVIGDANFIDHPHRGLTTGQTGRIGRGCVLYPCTLGGVTDKVKARHPRIGDFVLIGTDAGVFGLVDVGDRSVIGANTEIYGFVRLGRNVRMGSSVVARTVRSAAGPAGRLVIEDDAVIGDETLIINDQPSDLVIPARSSIPPHHHVVNDGFGRPKML
ncbi:MAG: hypothetical protein NTW86_09235 [Candidatus Sumerlaeota bacterium]|nr:hypothetical protein [Candidatus Sumerlaeota bacterium]